MCSILRNILLLAWTRGHILEAHVGFATRSPVSGPLWKSLCWKLTSRLFTLLRHLICLIRQKGMKKVKHFYCFQPWSQVFDCEWAYWGPLLKKWGGQTIYSPFFCPYLYPFVKHLEFLVRQGYSVFRNGTFQPSRNHQY